MPDPAKPRGERNVLVAGAETLAAIGAIRSLGRAGYRVHACSSDCDALGFRSRLATLRAVHPDTHSPDFVGWLHAYVREHGIDLIVPTEALLVAIQPVFGQFTSLLPVPSSKQTAFRIFSKYDTLATLVDSDCESARANVPATLFIKEGQPDPDADALAALGAPLHIKADAIHARSPARSITIRAESPKNARVQLADVRRRFDRAIVQGHVTGQGVGAFFLIRSGEVLAEFMHRRIHEVPHTGGVSSLRESWRHDAIRDDALAKLRALEWEGVAMMEYRWDRETGDFRFIEMNGRFWGSLHLALFAGVDFPVMLADAFFGIALSKAPANYPLGLRCRHTFPKEVQYVWSRWKDKRLTFGRKVADLLEFARLSIAPGVYSDLSFPGDRGLWFRGLLRWLGECTDSAGAPRHLRHQTRAPVEADPAVMHV